ncbi:ABC transporter substrate-binding protein [Naasia aerilata]|nr:extracellular solute-binding protein [Naasia aerilata]
MKARFLAGSTALVLGAAALAGCSAGGSGGSGDSGDGNVTMTLWQNSTTGEGQQFWKNAAADFTKANPKVTIKVQSIQNEDLDGKLQTALNSGDAPDIFLQRGGGKMAAMVAAGQLMDLTGKVDSTVQKELGEAALGADSLDDKLYAMPLTIQPGGFFYSQDLFKQAGITETPASIDDLSAAVDKLKGIGVAPIALGAKAAWPAAHWYYFFALRECDSKVLEKATTDKDFSDKCWIKAGEDLQKFSDTKPYNEGFLTTEPQQGAGSSAGLVANHKAAMELMGAWDAGVIADLTPDKKPLPDLGWFPFPEISGGKGEPGSILGGVDGYSCSVNAPKECVDFLNFVATAEQQTKYYQAFHTLPANSTAQESVTEPFLQSIRDAVNSAPFVSQWLDTLYGQNVGNALNVGVVDMLAGKGDPDSIVQSVADAAKKA